MAPSEPSFPGAVAPERSRDLESLGARLRLHEWGDPVPPPVVLGHGMFDHARGFDLLAPLLAARFRVIGIDARGHGDSDWADAYGWLAGGTDILNVLPSPRRPAHLGGHRGGGPEDARGLPRPRPGAPGCEPRRLRSGSGGLPTARVRGGRARSARALR